MYTTGRAEGSAKLLMQRCGYFSFATIGYRIALYTYLEFELLLETNGDKVVFKQTSLWTVFLDCVQSDVLFLCI